MINVTKTFLPPFEEYTAILKRAWDNEWITNNGELLQELEYKLKGYLRAEHLLFASNGTIVLQMALKALQISGEVITTPFSYVATTTAILWENCKPVFVDIRKDNFCIDETLIEAAITEKTQAILATHVYGYPCDIDAIEKIAKRYNLKVIYDAAHAFGTTYKGQSILNYGDISTCSFHATKVFHTGEGGCLVTNNDEIARQLFLYRSFGHIGDQYFTMGINGKNSEFHSAVGLCNLKYIDDILHKRKESWLTYQRLLTNSGLQLLQPEEGSGYNYAYFPVVFSSENQLLNALADLKVRDITPRRYFHPALNTLSYVEYQSCPVAESIAKRVLCLPLYHDLTEEVQHQVVDGLLTEAKVIAQ